MATIVELFLTSIYLIQGVKMVLFLDIEANASGIIIIKISVKGARD